MPQHNEQAQRLGAYLARIREARALTLDDMETIHGLNRRTVMKIESGKGGNIDSLLRYGECFNLTLHFKIKPGQ